MLKLKIRKKSNPEDTSQIDRFSRCSLAGSGTELQRAKQGVNQRNVFVGGGSEMQHQSDGVEMEWVETRGAVRFYHAHHHLG
jgi:hypothetical protein